MSLWKVDTKGVGTPSGATSETRQDKIERVSSEILTDLREQQLFSGAVMEYWKYHNVELLCLKLKSLLNSNDKLLLIPELLPSISPQHVATFRAAFAARPVFRPSDSASSLDASPPPRAGRSTPGTDTSAGEFKSASAPQTIILQKSSPSESLGLNVRGGSESNVCAFVSGLDPGGLAERSGLSIGDRIVSVNDTSTRKASHKEVIALLKSSDLLRVAVIGRTRSGVKKLEEECVWVDVSPSARGSTSRSRAGSESQTTSDDQRHVVLQSNTGRLGMRSVGVCVGVCEGSDIYKGESDITFIHEIIHISIWQILPLDCGFVIQREIPVHRFKHTRLLNPWT